MLLQTNKFYLVRESIVTLYLMTFLYLATTPSVFGHSYSVPEDNKTFVWRIKNPDGKYGTGFVLKDSVAGFFLVTNKHVVKSEVTGKYYDSVYVFKNIITKYKKAKSSDSVLILRLTHNRRRLYAEHSDENVDLVFIQLGNYVVGSDSVRNPSGIEKLAGWSSPMILNTRSISINDGASVQLIGYSLTLPQASQYAISRFGKISNYSAEKISVNIDGKYRKSQWIIVDASVRGGHSGGPVFSHAEGSKKLWLIGFVQAVDTKSELTFVIPSHYILDLLNKVREKIR